MAMNKTSYSVLLTFTDIASFLKRTDLIIDDCRTYLFLIFFK